MVAAALAAVTGCSAPSATERAKVLLDTDAAFARAAAVNGAAAAFRDYAALDALSLPQGQNPVHGREPIYRSMLPDTGELSWVPRGADIARGRDLGYTWGEYQFRETGLNGPGPVHYGKYLTVWKRQPDGSWKFVVDAGNPSPPPSAAHP